MNSTVTVPDHENAVALVWDRDTGSVLVCMLEYLGDGAISTWPVTDEDQEVELEVDLSGWNVADGVKELRQLLPNAVATRDMLVTMGFSGRFEPEHFAEGNS